MSTSEEKMLSIEAWRSSGLSQNKYCKALGIKRTTFANWVYLKGTFCFFIPYMRWQKFCGYKDFFSFEITFFSRSAHRISSLLYTATVSISL